MSKIKDASDFVKNLYVEAKNLANIENFAAISSVIITELFENKTLLPSLVASARYDENLRSMCEHYDILDKIILFDDPGTGIRLRLHLFSNSYFDRPHNHRWSYASAILHGSYKHTILVPKKSVDESITSSDLMPVLIRQEKVGDSYVLHHSQYHSITAGPDTVSLIIRGPSVKDRFRVMDATTGDAWWQYGAKVESKKERQAKRMSNERFEYCWNRLNLFGLISEKLCL